MAANTRWEFSPDGRLVLSISSDNRLRLFDVAGGGLRQQYVEKDHFGFRYTCCAWTQAVTWQDKKLVTVKAGKEGGLGLVALGTDKGTVSVWDLTRGVVVTRLGEGQSLKGVSGVAFSANGHLLYTSSAEPDVLEWDLKSKECKRKLAGDKHGSTALCMHPGTNVLAVARTKIYLLDGKSGERVAKLSSGHASAVTSMCFSADGRFLAAIAQGSRFVNVFDCKGSGKSAVASIALDSCPTSLSLHTCPLPSKTICLTLLVCGDLGDVKIIRQPMPADPDAEPETEGRKSVTLPASPSPILAARLSPSSPSSCVISGKDQSPLIHNALTFASGPSPEQLHSTLALPGAAAVADAEAPGSGKKRKRSEPSASDVKELALAKPGTTKAPTDSLQDSSLVPSPPSQPGDVATIGKKLKDMVSALEASSAKDDKKGKGILLPKTGSLVTVLSQALKSSDEDLLEQCLQTNSAQVVDTTIRLLPPPLVLELLDILAKKLERKPQRAVDLAVWVRLILQHHAAYLMSQPSLPKRVAGIYQLAVKRVAALPKLLSIAGRLELMLAQISKHTAGAKPVQEKTKTMVFVDNDD